MSDEGYGVELNDAEEPTDGSISATLIAQYIRFNCCPRFFKLRITHQPFRPIGPLLAHEGDKLEETTTEQLKEKTDEFHDFEKYDPKYLKDWATPVKESMAELREIIERQIELGEKADPKPVLVYQAPMCGTIGTWMVRGKADLIAIWPPQNGKVKVRIFELKASWQEQTAHRSQVAIYMLLLRQQMGELCGRVEVEGGVINRKTKPETLDADKLPQFRESPLIQDVQQLLAKNGELHRIRNKPIEEIEYQISWRCDNCGYNENCIAQAIDNRSISLLNLTRGEQSALSQHHIVTLDDLAKLRLVKDEYSARPNDFKSASARDSQSQQVIDELSTDPIVGAKVNMLIERSQYMLSGVHPNNPYASKSRYMPWLTGSGYGSLPDDNLEAEAEGNVWGQKNSLIRVYLFVEWDYLLEVISIISARVTSSRFKGEPLSVSRVIGAFSDDRKECLVHEEKMLEDFFAGLTQAITKMAKEVGSPDSATLHLYFFSRHERDVLMRAVCNHKALIGAQVIRDLLGLREAIDQPMFSIIQDEVQHRKALKSPSSGLLPILEQACFFSFKNWMEKRVDGTTVDLKSVFNNGFFNYLLPYAKKPDGAIHILGNKERGSVGFYPARARFGDQLPIEYVWGAKRRLDRFTQDGSLKALEKYKWCDHSQVNRITDEELGLMGAKICLAIEAIERSLNFRNRYLGKEPIPISTIDSFSLGDATLERSCREFMDLEYFSKRQELYQHYAMLPYQRVASGRSLIFQCSSVCESDKEFVVQGKLLYEGIGLPRAELVANACRIKGSDGSSSGDWMVVTELRRNEQGQFEESQRRAPSEVEKSARAIVSKVDVSKLEITVKVVTWPRGRGSKYSAWHNLPTTNPEKAQSPYMQLFEAGRYYIIDELADDIVSDRAAKCLDNAGNNVLYSLLAEYLAGKTCGSCHTALPMGGATQFLNWAKTRPHPPKAEQAKFVDRVFGAEPIVMLQGPPGTGKTETLQLAVLAHVAAHRTAGRCRVLMVAPTHKAIQEFVIKLAQCWQEYTAAGGVDLKDLRILRVLSSSASAATPIEGVKYINYHEDEGLVKELGGYLMNQTTLTPQASAAYPLILCTTPPGLYGLMKKIGDKEPPWGEGFFDLLVVDEASMMRVPEFILSGSFLCRSSQILVAGDHRQLPPIVAHNWEKEDRRTLEEMASFLSAVDFLRLLRNEDLGIERIECKHPADIPADRLCESHRCHRVVADFLRKWVYEKDEIDFRSNQKQGLPPPKPSTEGLGVALEPDNIFVLIVHDEAKSFQSNLVEAAIVQALVQNAPTDSVGVITPHNAQKGLLKNKLSDGNENTRVDTVERYQGGEADFIVISTTVSDPDYVRTESEFLLNLNRINVAISRMKKKLVIVASRSIFEFMPQDARDYDKAVLWRGISETVGFTADSKAKWTGDLSAFLGQNAVPVKIEIYVKSQKA